MRESISWLSSYSWSLDSVPGSCAEVSGLAWTFVGELRPEVLVSDREHGVWEGKTCRNVAQKSEI